MGGGGHYLRAPFSLRKASAIVVGHHLQTSDSIPSILQSSFLQQTLQEFFFWGGEGDIQSWIGMALISHDLRLSVSLN